MHVIVADASLKKGVCGIGVVLVNEYGHEVTRHQEKLTAISHSHDAELNAIRVGIQKFGHISQLIYNDCRKAIQLARHAVWRLPDVRIEWMPEHLRGTYLHFVAHELSVMARRIKMIYVKHTTPSLSPRYRGYPSIKEAIEAVCKASHEPSEDIRLALFNTEPSLFKLGEDEWSVISEEEFTKMDDRP